MTEAGEDEKNDQKARPFICGVVEGFYGRPWTLSQRKDLFEKMEAWGMTSYLYAPKDDCKHRAFWRELYTVEEAEHLQSLILAAQESSVDFYYALSPGIDITYSNSKEIATLKRKLDQVAQLGCRSFALLFDDIEAEMSKPDKEAFQSFAHAQVSVCNEIYQHLGQPHFLFCPTQYCTTRAVPTVATSEYLKTIGAKLAPDIDIMWTGDKVIPKEITVSSLEGITQILKRAPVIWDNEHANDYDQKRVYLGPYSGRSPDIIQKLRGVMTNPNCEYGANFVAIHSLAAWSKCTVDGCSSLSANDTVSSDIKLELGTSGNGEEDVVPPPPHQLPPHVYHPRLALDAAISDWLPEFSRPRSMWGPITKPQVGLNPAGILQPSISTCMTSTATTSCMTAPVVTTVSNSSANASVLRPPSPKGGGGGGLALTSTSQPLVPGLVNPYAVVSTGLACPPLVPMMNSLVSSHEVVMERPGPDGVSPIIESKTLQAEPMETNLDTEGGGGGVVERNGAPPSPTTKADVLMESNTNPSTPASIMQIEPHDLGGGGGLSKAESTTMLCEPPPSPDTTALTLADLQLICDLFYLPCEHGPKAIELLTEFYWLKTNAGCCLQESEEESEVTRPEWERRREHFAHLVRNIKTAFRRLCQAPNRELVYNLYTYVWDIVGVSLLLQSYVEWLALGQFSPKYKQLIIGRHTWFSGIREAFLSGDHEPWVFRGGLTADLQRLMPVDSGNDLFIYQFPDQPTTNIYNIRPFRPQDEDQCYRIAMQTWEDGMDATEYYASHPRLIGEKSIGPFLAFYSSLCFVFESNEGEIVGYIVASPNLKELHERVSVAWLPDLRAKYARVEEAGEMLTPCEATINTLYTEPELPPGLESPESWAVVRLAILPQVTDYSLARRSTMLLLACLRTTGVLKLLAEVPKKEKLVQDLYTRIGFSTLLEAPTDVKEDNIFLCRRY